MGYCCFCVEQGKSCQSLQCVPERWQPRNVVRPRAGHRSRERFSFCESKKWPLFANSSGVKPAGECLNSYRMKAQCSKQSDTPGCLATTDKSDSSWPLPCGLLMPGLFLIAFAGWEALRAGSQTLLYSCGAILCFAGLVLIWIGTTKLARCGEEQKKFKDDEELGLVGMARSQRTLGMTLCLQIKA
jgi:hypothetical protein